MNKQTLKKIGIPVATIIASVGLGFAGITSAQSTSSPTSNTTRPMMRARPVAVGQVTAVSGTRITMSSTNPKDKSVTLYTVDASSAAIEKGSAGLAPTTASLADIAVGDTIAVEGTVSGTTIQATKILDGIMARGMGMGMRMGKGPDGRGEGAHGTVTAVSGSTITVTGADGTTYSVNASSAKVSKVVDISVSDIKVGDVIDAHGTRSGSTVTATHIMDGIPTGPGTR